MAQKILYLVSEDWYFVSHRLPMARAAKRAGYEVHVATRVADYAAAIEREGFILHPISAGVAAASIRCACCRRCRGNASSLSAVAARSCPPCGSAAGRDRLARRARTADARAQCLRRTRLYLHSATPKARLLRCLAGSFSAGCWPAQRTVLVQNPDDRAAIAKLGVPATGSRPFPARASTSMRSRRLPRARRLRLSPSALSAGCSTTRACGRWSRACDSDAERGPPFASCSPARPTRSTRPRSRTHPRRWRKRPNLVLLGHVDDMRSVWRRRISPCCRRAAGRDCR